MKVKYNRENDVLYIQLSNNSIAESDSEKPGIIIDYDDRENIFGFEVYVHPGIVAAQPDDGYYRR